MIPDFGIRHLNMALQVMTTGVAGGLIRPYKGLVLAKRLKTRRTVRQPLIFYGQPLKGLLLRLIPSGLLFALFYWLARERVCELFHTQLVLRYIFLQLFPDVLLYRLFVAPYCIHIIPATPEMPIPIFILQIRMPIEYHQATLPFQVSHHI